ncbi:hypothetical protein DYB37_012016 [Aphanomyces astaci]|uniref:Uncharacterized protein n=1 Tax=Aphanomyces astaci TaxID=112090 RepID=A0A3R7EF15_APHAT|nr:hypothetical protein DYB35_008898 [Aphanomyces astaci]RHZ20489.1 hypothetical protein DYB37_012016 [Aphanomyces astaci]
MKQASNVPLTDDKYCHNILAEAPPDVLNGILGATSPEGSDSFCSTMTGFMLHTCSSVVRSRVLDVITHERLDDINLTNRGIIIRAIQQHLASPLNRQKPDFQKAAFNVIKGTYGSDLTRLKEVINSDFLLPSHDHGGFHGGDLHQLIYGCRDLTQVVSVAQHIAVEALKVVQSPPLIKILSDIDDTLFAGWVDARYPGHTLYPGVTTLFQCMSRGVDCSNPSVTFLTARPRGWFSFGRNLTADRLVSLGLANPTVLNGSVRTGVNPKKIAGSVLGTFIHDINPSSPLTGDGGAKADYVKYVHCLSVIVDDSNYAAAGMIAFELGLISKEDLTLVVQSCRDELDMMTFTGWNSTQKQADRKQELVNDCDRFDSKHSIPSTSK